MLLRSPTSFSLEMDTVLEMHGTFQLQNDGDLAPQMKDRP
jgi:hypothetical protein